MLSIKKLKTVYYGCKYIFNQISKRIIAQYPFRDLFALSLNADILIIFDKSEHIFCIKMNSNNNNKS